MNTRSCSTSKKRKLSENVSTEAELESMKAENQKLKQEVQKQKLTILDLANANTELKKEQGMAVKLQSDLIEAQNKLENQKNHNEAEIEKLKAVVDGHVSEVNELKEKISILKKVKSEYVAKNDEGEVRFEIEKEKFKAEINDLKSKIDELNEKDDAWKAKMDAAHQKINSFAKEIFKLKNQLSAIDAAKNVLKMKCNELEAQLTSERKEFKNKLSQQQFVADNLLKEKLNFEMNEQIFENRIAEYEIQIESFKHQQQSTRNMVSDYEKKIKELEDELKAIKDETDLLYIEVKDMHDGKQLCYGQLDSRTIVNVGKLKSSDDNIWKFYTSADSPAFEVDVEEVFKRCQFRLHLNGSFVCKDDQNKRRIQEIIPRVYSCTLQNLCLIGQILEEYDFFKFVSSQTLTIVKFQEVSIKKSNVVVKKCGNNEEFMKLDEILEHLPNIEVFEYHFKYFNDVTSRTSKYLAKLPRFEKLKEFKLFKCARTFNLEYFGGFTKKHESAKFVLEYRPYCRAIQAKINRASKSIASTCAVETSFSH